MKGLFKPKARTPAEIVRLTRDILIFLDSDAGSSRGSKREEKYLEFALLIQELSKLVRELKSILYGSSEAEPVPEACMQLTQEFFKENTLRLLVICLPKLNLETRKDATQIVANLQRQQVNSRLIASEYLENNKDLMDILIAGYESTDMALHYGSMLRECIRHQVVARLRMPLLMSPIYVLYSEQFIKFFHYIQLPNFDIAADAAATFKELLTRHKSTVAEFLSKNYDWFFAEYNSKLLESSNYITRRHAVKLLGDMLLDRSNSATMTRYVSSKDNLRIFMNLLRENSKSIQLESFHVFKLFVANQNKPPDIANILYANKSKFLRLLAELKPDKAPAKKSRVPTDLILGPSVRWVSGSPPADSGPSCQTWFTFVSFIGTSSVANKITSKSAAYAAFSPDTLKLSWPSLSPVEYDITGEVYAITFPSGPTVATRHWDPTMPPPEEGLIAQLTHLPGTATPARR
ncbi:hypothetical protein V2J09_012284 [Rumex salicifolius]